MVQREDVADGGAVTSRCTGRRRGGRLWRGSDQRRGAGRPRAGGTWSARCAVTRMRGHDANRRRRCWYVRVLVARRGWIAENWEGMRARGLGLCGAARDYADIGGGPFTSSCRRCLDDGRYFQLWSSRTYARTPGRHADYAQAHGVTPNDSAPCRWPRSAWTILTVAGRDGWLIRRCGETSCRPHTAKAGRGRRPAGGDPGWCRRGSMITGMSSTATSVRPRRRSF